MKIQLIKQKFKTQKDGKFGPYNMYIWEFKNLATGEILNGSVNGNDDWKEKQIVDIKELETYHKKDGTTGYNIKAFNKKELEAVRLALGQVQSAPPAKSPISDYDKGAEQVAMSNIETSLSRLEQNYSKLNYLILSIAEKVGLELTEDRNDIIPF